MNDKQEGLLVPATKEFYYLESNVYLKAISLSTVIKTLTQRGIINNVGLDGKNTAAIPHRQGTWADAKELGYKAVPMHHNPHLKKVSEGITEAEKTSPWG